jgi:putative two-component system response regulator
MPARHHDAGHVRLRDLRSAQADPATQRIPIIFLTAMTATEDQKKGLDLGAGDCITKPISPPIVLARVKTQLENEAAAEFLRNQAEYLRAEVDKQTQLVTAIQDVIILATTNLTS